MTYDHAQALALDALWTMTRICEQVSDDQLNLPTPCTGWDLDSLLEHLTGQQHGIATSLSGAGNDLADWRSLPAGKERAAFLDSARAVRVALLDEPPETAWMPEIRSDAPLPTSFVVHAFLVDTVAHGWDVAATIGVPVEFSPQVLSTAYAAARQIPDDAERDRPGAVFAHALPGGDQPTLAGYLALLGRDISWSPKN